MALTFLAAVALTAALIAYVVHVTRGRLIYGPETLFLTTGVCTFGATAHAAGAVGMLGDPYVQFMGVGLVAFLVGVLACNTLARFDHAHELSRFVAREWIDDLRGLPFLTVLVIGAVAVVVVAAYFYFLGFLVPFAAIARLREAGPAAMIETYNELRRATRTGSYLGLGYVSQFKDCLLPLITLLMVFRLRVRRDLTTLLLLLGFLGATLIAAAGTGARYPLAVFGGAFLIVGAANYTRPFRLSRTGMATAVVVLLVALSALTMMMGARGQQGPGADSLLWAPYNVAYRICIGPAHERFEAYRLYVHELEPQWGSATLEQLAIVLPGRPERTLSNTLHERLYGSASGNVTLDAWGWLWLDFRWAGVIVASVYGFLQHLFYIWLIRGDKSLIRVVGLTYAGFILGLATDPQVLLLRGFATVLIFLALTRLPAVVASLATLRAASSPAGAGQRHGP